MRSLYITHCKRFGNTNTSDVNSWNQIFKVIPPTISLVDRCDSIVMPYNYKLYEPFRMPTDLAKFNMSYEDCANEQAQKIINISRKIDKPITILYSGGIDSTGVLISFMKLLTQREVKERINVALTIDSIYENPNFYYKFIRPLCKIISSEYIGSLLDGSSIVVGGELNDQLFGSDIIGNISRFGDYSKINQPYTREFITGWFNNSISNAYSNLWFDLLDTHIKSNAPCEVITNFHFFWWYNFCFKWQNVFFRMLLLTNTEHRHLLSDIFLKDHYHQFYSSVNFQKWSMLNHSLKITDFWKCYKLETKKMIYEFNKDKEYFDTKIKSGSLYRLFLQKTISAGITSNYEFISENHLRNSSEFYNPNNSFANKHSKKIALQELSMQII